jgi:phage portal protein BeeE
MAILDAARRGFRGKPVSAGSVGSSLYGYPMLGRHGLDWHREAGVRYDNSIVFAAVMFAVDAMSEVDVYVRRPKDDGWEDVKGHPITKLLEDPNPWYGWGQLLSGWVISELTGVGGQSYTYKHRSGAGKVIALEYVPHFACRPMWGPNSGNFVDYYQFTMQSGLTRVAPQDLIVQRFGPINPLRVQYAVGPLESCLLEVVTDKEAANYTASLLRNVGVTPHLISPNFKGPDGLEVVFGPAQREQMERVWDEKISGDNRGRPLMSPLPIKVDSLSMNPEEMNLEAIRNINEERVCAALRIPPQVLHLGTGLENQNNRASAEEAAKSAARSFTKPYMRKKGRELTRDLIPELGQPGEEVCFRWQDIEALQEAGADRAKRLSTECGGPYRTVNEVREDEGDDPVEGGDELRSGQPQNNEDGKPGTDKRDDKGKR